MRRGEWEGEGRGYLHQRLFCPGRDEKRHQVVVNEGVTVVEIAHAVLEVADALVRLGLADRARGDGRVLREAHDCRDEAAGVEEGALNPRIRERHGGVGDEIGGVRIEELGVALVQQRVDGFSPIPPLHVMRYDAVVVLVEACKEKQRLRSPVAADELIHSVTMHHAVIITQKTLEVPRSSLKFITAGDAGA